MTFQNKQKYNHIILAFFIVIVMSPNFADAQKRVHSVFFENTDYELNVYKIHGELPGKTIMLIGGIQGNEPGGFLSVDHYADISLSKGRLIVVPRANFQSIVLNRRQINDDMNRKFAEDQKSNYETKIVAILKKLIAESDCLLNVHDGSGFFSEVWKGPNRNSMKYGQSIITDCESYVNPKTGQVLELGKIAQSVCKAVNKNIKNSDHHFHFNNHKTKDKSSLHKEQRKSATYYALYTCGVPSFGIETSKSLSIETKVRQHSLAINAFMENFGIVPETPGINLEIPVLNYVVISVNDSLPIVIKNQQTLYINPKDEITISHIEANYERGLSADIIGHGAINDIRKKVSITGHTRIIVRKDYYPCGSIYIAMGGNLNNIANNVSVSNNVSLGSSLLFFKIKINGKEQVAQNFDHVKLIRGDTLELVDIISGFGDPSDLEVNFKGYVGDQYNNTGEDRGYVINTGRDLWKRYSVHKKGKTYQVVVTRKNTKVGKLFVDLTDPILKYVVVQSGNDKMHCVASGEKIVINGKQPLRLIDINTNVQNNSGINAFIIGPGSFKKSIKIQKALVVQDLFKNGKYPSSDRYRIEIARDKILLGSILFDFVQEEHNET